jgi:hypothetical protein
MSPTERQGSDSKIAHAYDEAIARAQVAPDERDGTHGSVRGGPATTTADPDALLASSGIIEATPATAESKLGPGEELRDREFPVPAEAAGTPSRKLVVNANSLPEDESRRGGRPGTIVGDVQPATVTPSIIDQDAVEPDLASEQH